MKSYKDLEVWQKAVSLLTEIYKITKNLPQDEKFGLVSQIQRAATSIPANIAEGWGRGTTKEYIQFLRVARGSLLELETHLIIAQNLSYLTQDVANPIQQKLESIGMMLNRLIQSLKKK